MTDATLGGRVFEPPTFRPAWLRPAVIALVVALHAAALLTLPRLASKPPEPPQEVMVDIQPEAPAPEAPKEPEALPPPPLEEAAPPPEPAPPVAE
ncbi:MAG TPA: hypothetical protein VKA12_08330, partial [Roseiarcus sp.]|nr:hypothetical protein [Roseiarcus sp.]